MDWMDRSRIDRFTYEMIDPFNIDTSRGYLENVVSSSTMITHGYYTDTRVSAKITVADHNYIPYSLIRIHHYVDDENFHEELGTFFVSSISSSTEYVKEDTFNLVSMINRISDDVLPWNYSIGMNKSALNAIKDLFSKFGVSYSILAGCGDKVYSSAVVYGVGESVLSTIFELASFCGNRLGVNGHGTLTLSPYSVPSSKTPVFEFNDHNGTVIGAITKNNNPFDSVNRVVVSAEKNEQKVTGYADVDNASAIAYSKLGRRKAVIETVNELSPFNGSQASLKAKSLLASYEQDPAEYSFQGIYTNLNPGDVVTIGIDGQYKKAMIKNKEFTLDPGMACSYTCKEV